MVSFVVMFFGIYALMNVYLFLKVYAAAFALGKLYVVLGLLLAIMVSMPIWARRLDSMGHWLAMPVTLVAFSWLAIVFWFAATGLAIDAWNVVLRMASLVAPGAGRAIVPGRVLLLSAGAVVAIMTTWGIVEAQSIRANHVTIHVPHMPDGMNELRIAQITDLHLGPYTGSWRLGKVLDIVRSEGPDVIVTTGDLIDSPAWRLAAQAQRLSTLHAPLGKYAVLGNHEFYVGVEESEKFHAQAGLKLLRGQAVSPVDGLVIAGVDDRAMGLAASHENVDELPILSPRAADSLVILLKHQPRINQAAAGLFDLQISGHTHAGQLFPFHFISRAAYPLYRGLHDLGNGGRLYVSSGAGTWGPPFRVLARPEVTIFTFTKQ
ncbi:MAG: hypothetical protein GXY38_01840 [Planctomycetes bacterium]|jgi:predicted MPP superfamily phosphohydrolase|nr:hypothetical protein [Planctomycetota bacterium]